MMPRNNLFPMRAGDFRPPPAAKALPDSLLIIRLSRAELIFWELACRGRPIPGTARAPSWVHATAKNDPSLRRILSCQKRSARQMGNFVKPQLLRFLVNFL